MRSLSRPKTVAVGVATIALIAVWYALWDEDPKSFTGASGRAAEKLFEPMGIIALPQIVPPVDVTLEDLNGETVQLSDLRGNIVFLNFWTTWCPDCREEMPSMETLHRRFKDRGFSMVAVNLRESAETVRVFAEKAGLTFTNLLDPGGGAAQSFGVRAIPSTFIMDETGALIGKAFGPRDWDSRQSYQVFENLLTSSADRQVPGTGDPQ